MQYIVTLLDFHTDTYHVSEVLTQPLFSKPTKKLVDTVHIPSGLGGFIVLALCSLFLNDVKAADYCWNYNGGVNYPQMFPSYEAACEIDRADREKRSRGEAKYYSLADGSSTPCGVSGVIYRDQNGAPTYYLCGFEYWISTLQRAARTCQGFIRLGNGCAAPKKLNLVTGSCELPAENPKNPPESCPKAGNPINIITGNKYADETDYQGIGISPLHFARHYNSFAGYYYQTLFGTAGITRSPVGLHWHHNYYKGLTVSPTEVKLTLASGQSFIFGQISGTWQPDADVEYRLEEILTAGVRTGWKVTTPDDTVETYNAVGDLLSIIDRNGTSQTLAYSCTTVSATCPVVTPTTIAPFAGLLVNVTDSFGRSLN